MNRRDALKGLGALAGAGTLPRFLSGCGWDKGDGRITGITNTVIVCMENRTYDHMLGARAFEGLAGNGLREGMFNPREDGTREEIYHEASTLEVPDPPHGWDTSRGQFNEGANDGFMRIYQEERGEDVPAHVMGYFLRDDLPFSWALADRYATSDAWFASVMGPTWPNRMFLHSGQSGGLIYNDLPESGGINWPSIHHQLNDAGVDWVYYWQDLPFVPLFKDLDIEGKVQRINRFFKDAAEGTLPSVSFVEPNFSLNDDHPPHAPILGQQFLASLYAALAQGPQWENTLLIITYDEHGGFFDHVPPPKADDARAAEGFDQLGFRVPAFVAGPYVKQGYVDSTPRDHTSVLKHLSVVYGLEPLTERVAWAPDLFDFLDLDRLERGEPADPIDVPEINVPRALIEETCARNFCSQPELAALVESGVIDRQYDRRGHLREDAFELAAIAKRLGVSRG